MDSPKELFYDAVYRREFEKAKGLLNELRGFSKDRAEKYLNAIMGVNIKTISKNQFIKGI
ncbi:MAG: hypothetical protein ABIJ43_05875 [Candidatus Beckwithbacteria bacterium]|uniref:Uncharacterized protein n=1 Tax=viral metagenome TaxID=1070528 RepID=A0A6M3JUA7_9ZZZZ